MKYGSVCSGIEAATVAWHSLGWKPSFFSEIDNFPRAVLEHHYPEVPLHGDFTTIGENDYEPIRLLVGGTPCQSFSVAGLRKGLADERGNLALEYLRLAQRLRPTWLVWENVPGVLSSNRGRDFASFLGGLAECGYGFAYRVLDAQYFGVAQRRRRVFVVGRLGDWRAAAAVLLERESLSGNPKPRREAKQNAAATVKKSVARMRGFGDYEIDETVSAAKARDYKDATDLVIEAREPANCHSALDHVTPKFADNIAGTLNARDYKGPQAVCFQQNASGELRENDVAYTLNTNSNASGRNTGLLRTNSIVRRLTPIECERLQGFPDNYTKIPYRNKPIDKCPDGPRYKALGNSMAVPVMRWIGERIEMVDAILKEHKGAA